VKRRTFLAAAAVLLAPSVARADAVDDALARIAKARTGLGSLRATFTQKRVIKLMATAIESSGRVAVVRPDRLRWDLEPPDAVTYWIGPEGLTMKNAEGVTKIDKNSTDRFASVIADLLVMLGGDLRTLRERYGIEVQEKAVDGGSQLTLTLRPTGKLKKTIEKVKLVAGPDLSILKGVSIHEKNGDSSKILFKSFAKNPEIDPDEMKPPA
jgi:outer membrane lipoprotein-sorting protein